MKTTRLGITLASLLLAPLVTAANVEDGILKLQHEWARIKYEMTDEDAQIDAIHQLETEAGNLRVENPDRAEPLIWEGIILATDAGIDSGISALSKVREAKELFEKALAIDPDALDGSAYTSLGSLYYQVPGWPLSFGDDDMAEEMLHKALTINPDGIDSNYFMGDYLLQEDRYEEARTYFEKALNAPARPNRPLADSGRRNEIETALGKIRKELGE